MPGPVEWSLSVHDAVAEPHAVVRWAALIGEEDCELHDLGDLAARVLGVDAREAEAVLARAETEADSLAALFR